MITDALITEDLGTQDEQSDQKVNITHKSTTRACVQIKKYSTRLRPILY